MNLNPWLIYWNISIIIISDWDGYVKKICEVDENIYFNLIFTFLLTALDLIAIIFNGCLKCAFFG